jgi:hypothetical protein
MATHAHTTPAPQEPISEATAALLAPFFPRWRGEAPEPVLAAPRPRMPAPAARQLVEA